MCVLVCASQMFAFITDGQENTDGPLFEYTHWTLKVGTNKYEYVSVYMFVCLCVSV